MKNVFKTRFLLLSALLLNGCSLFEVHENDKQLFKQQLTDLAVCHGSAMITHKMPSEPLYSISPMRGAASALLRMIWSMATTTQVLAVRGSKSTSSTPIRMSSARR